MIHISKLNLISLVIVQRNRNKYPPLFNVINQRKLLLDNLANFWRKEVLVLLNLLNSGWGRFQSNLAPKSQHLARFLVRKRSYCMFKDVEQ